MFRLHILVIILNGISTEISKGDANGYYCPVGTGWEETGNQLSVTWEHATVSNHTHIVHDLNDRFILLLYLAT